MKAEPVGEDSLRIWLSDKELVRWGLSFDKSAPRNCASLRRLLGHLPSVTASSGGSRMVAELFPVEGGGVLLLSPCRAAAGSRWPAVYYIENEETLFSLAERWCQLPSQQPACTALYVFGEGYCLTVCPLEPLSESHRRLLAEYGRPAGRGEGAAAVCGEHGRLLCAPCALEKLAGKERHFTELAPPPQERPGPRP